MGLTHKLVALVILAKTKGIHRMLEYFPGALSIYQIGSSTIDYIDNPRDIDYLVVFPTHEALENCLAETGIEPIHTIGDDHYFLTALEDFTSGRWIELDQVQYGDSAYRPGYAM